MPAAAGNSLAASIPHVAAPAGGATSGAGRSFAGQGRDIYETTSPARSAGTLAGGAAGISASRPNSFRFGGSTLAGRSITTRSTVLPGTAFSGFGRVGTPGVFSGVGPRFGVGFGTFRFRRPFFGFDFGSGFGFFPGFGFGLGFGPWGSCYGGWAWDWDPAFCFNSFSPWPSYGYFGYPAYGPYGYPPSVGYDPNFGPHDPDSNPPPSSSSAPSGPVNPNFDTSLNAPDAPGGPVIIYLKDGTSFSPSDYWISDNQLHYVLGGSENAVDIDRVDLPRTNDENQKNGVKFWLKSAPDASPAPSGAAPAAAPAPDSPAPTI